jgi:uncharacterized membrane protein
LTDAVFAFAMTLLVINIELPEGFHPKTNQEFLHGLSGLSDTFVRPFGSLRSSGTAR